MLKPILTRLYAACFYVRVLGKTLVGTVDFRSISRVRANEIASPALSPAKILKAVVGVRL